jgi:hypothetical protein
MNNSFYIVPTFNKDFLILDVLNGIVKSHSSNDIPTIICLVDGCTDNTETLVNSFKESYKDPQKMHIIKLNDVHEIRSLNHGLEYIKNNLSPNSDDLIFMIQDDVILNDENINLKFNKLFEYRKDLGYVSMRFGCKLHSFNNDIHESDFTESEFGHWSQPNIHFNCKILKHLEFQTFQIVVRSPTCVQWRTFESVGFFDDNLAPLGYDCHDFSIRCNLKGYTNGVLAIKFKSDVSWGSTRSPNKKYNMKSIYERNRKYLANKHKDYFSKLKFLENSIISTSK